MFLAMLPSENWVESRRETTNMAAVSQSFLVRRSIWSSFLKMSNRRAAIHRKVTLASTHGDPLVGILSADMHVCLILASSGGEARKTACGKMGEKREQLGERKGRLSRCTPTN